ncbi:dihydrodipicolinate reductase [Halovivax asiaticus JCM 14624]|uniref:4-hydroxy-tetrahydrodipicolinate reductase n=1 Tax=Halovivax asiaticus JCM 14624 TaxID=1227490 RepID=M0BRA2_9EURY|nr:4-hydroxy-tetrahydrodipicolinate reductase [Halovivax asiaticus]ELZ12224.1 dihydrodipicolinate reductase [Halovivax asiaticus JCM 14624]
MTDRSSSLDSAGPLRLGVTGATGRMGRVVLATAVERPDCDVVFAVNRSPASDAVEGVEIEPAVAFDALIADREPHAVVDFTGAGAAVDYAVTCAEEGVPFVTGTTGMDETQLDRLCEASESVPVLHASNFSRGVAVLDELLAEAVRRLPDYDIELVETHHSGKRDAPSGTTTRLLATLESAHPGEDEIPDRVHGREGDAPREPGEIGVHSVRAGAIAGEHEILLAGNHEEIRLCHRAGDRGVFAAGALDAAAWLAGRDPGWYDFREVIDA